MKKLRDRFHPSLAHKGGSHACDVLPADAALIAAAPDLLTACEALVNLRIGSSTAEIASAIDDGVAAIRKARTIQGVP